MILLFIRIHRHPHSDAASISSDRGLAKGKPGNPARRAKENAARISGHEKH